MSAMAEDPQIAANLARISEETGYPLDAYLAWVEEPCPDGIDPENWVSAKRTRAREGAPWPEEAKENLRLRAAPVARRVSAA